MSVSPQLRTGATAAAVALGMLGVGYGAVPLYDMFCRATGFGGTTQRVDAALAAEIPVGSNRPITVRFDSNVDRDLPWEFEPERNRDTLSIGARDMAVFTAKNLGTEAITGTASFNVTPVAAGKYFSKIQCFCFTEQVIEAGQEVRMPVLYFVDPKILDDPEARDIEEITLSYTFHRAKSDGDDEI